MHGEITALVGGVPATDDEGRNHRDRALRWLDSTTDIWRRCKPATPDPHLVVYFLLVDRNAGRVLLCDHRLSGLWLPTGGHVEPGEHPVATVARECVEELGVPAVFDARCGANPFFVTVTRTVGVDAPHTDVTLWFAVVGRVGQELTPDPGEFLGVRWWTPAEIQAEAPERFEPHLARAFAALGMK